MEKPEPTWEDVYKELLTYPSGVCHPMYKLLLALERIYPKYKLYHSKYNVHRYLAAMGYIAFNEKDDKFIVHPKRLEIKTLYKTSKDYEKLADILEANTRCNVVGPDGGIYYFTDYSEYDYKRTDMRYTGGTDERSWHAETRKEFIEECIKRNVEFIVPECNQKGE